MDITQLNKYLDKVLSISKAIELDIDLSYKKVILLINLLKQISIYLQIDINELVKELQLNPPKFLSRLHELILEEFDYDKEEYGVLSKKILYILSGILKLNKPLEETQMLEFLETINSLSLKIQEKLGSDFLAMSGMTSPDNQEKSSTTETE